MRIALYFDRTKIGRIDVDNRAKDVMDALQGLTGGFGTKVLGIRNSSKLHREINVRDLPFIV